MFSTKDARTFLRMLILANLDSYFWPWRARNRFSQIFPKFWGTLENKTRNLRKIDISCLKIENEGRFNFWPWPRFYRFDPALFTFVHFLLNVIQLENSSFRLRVLSILLFMRSFFFSAVIFLKWVIFWVEVISQGSGHPLYLTLQSGSC